MFLIKVEWSDEKIKKTSMNHSCFSWWEIIMHIVGIEGSIGMS